MKRSERFFFLAFLFLAFILAPGTQFSGSVAFAQRSTNSISKNGLLNPEIKDSAQLVGSFHGQWKGQGFLLVGQSGESQSCELYLEFRQSSERFQVLRSEFICPSMKIKNKESKPLAISRSRLFSDGQEVGFLNETTLYSLYTNQQGQTQSYLITYSSLTRTLDYSDDIFWSQSLRTRISGTLVRVSDSLWND